MLEFQKEDSACVVECHASLAQREDDVESTASTAPAFGCESQDFSSCSQQSLVASDPGGLNIEPPSSQAETLVLFDWDDTLVPTSWLHHVCPSLDETTLSEEDKAVLMSLEQSAKALLVAAQEHGRVVIVTNSQTGWVELSCRKFTPGLLHVLEDLKVVSARSAHETDGEFAPVAWKIKAFQSEVDDFFTSHDGGCSRRNILSVGDSLHEHEALLAAAEGVVECRAKSVKLMERPGPLQLREELELVLHSLGEVIDHDGCLDYTITSNATS